VSKKKSDIFTKLIVTLFILKTGFLTSISTPLSYAQYIGLSDLPLLDYDIESNDKFKELYEMFASLNSKDITKEDSDTNADNKVSEGKKA
jgi:hypothetical protein